MLAEVEEVVESPPSDTIETVEELEAIHQDTIKTLPVIDLMESPVPIDMDSPNSPPLQVPEEPLAPLSESQNMIEEDCPPTYHVLDGEDETPAPDLGLFADDGVGIAPPPEVESQDAIKVGGPPPICILDFEDDGFAPDLGLFAKDDVEMEPLPEVESQDTIQVKKYRCLRTCLLHTGRRTMSERLSFLTSSRRSSAPVIVHCWRRLWRRSSAIMRRQRGFVPIANEGNAQRSAGGSVRCWSRRLTRYGYRSPCQRSNPRTPLIRPWYRAQREYKTSHARTRSMRVPDASGMELQLRPLTLSHASNAPHTGVASIVLQYGGRRVAL